MAWYAKGFPGAAQLREKLSRIESIGEGIELLDRAIALAQQQPFDSAHCATKKNSDRESVKLV